VLTFDGRGNGRSDRPADAAAYEQEEFAADALAVMDATGTESAVLVSLSMGGQRGLLLAGNHPDRVERAVFIGAHVPLARLGRERASAMEGFEEPRDSYDGWEKVNRHYWLQDFEGFLEFFFSQAFVEPHSTKQTEDSIGYGLETTPETLIATMVQLACCLPMRSMRRSSRSRAAATAPKRGIPSRST
jgi:pimeloyl-ACP methyl ester carboxylesterase